MPAASEMRVLVVDDQFTFRSIVKNNLKQIGIEKVAEASDGEEGVAAAIKLRPNLILTDYYMPKMDGLELLQCVRGNEQTRSMAVFLVSGRADKELVERAVQLGVNNYLVKPISSATLKEKIEQVFGDLT